MNASLRLLTIETRRTVAVWFVPIVAALAWLVAREEASPRWLWVEASAATGFALVFVGPLMGGVAAWTAGRDRRRGMEDLLLTTGRPVVARELTAWAATATWGVLVYLAVAALLLMPAAREATWGGPDPSPIVVGLLAVIAATAIGHLVGALASNRLAAPVVAVGLFVALLVPTAQFEHTSAVAFLSPWTFVEPNQYGVLHGIWPDLGLRLSLWLLGLAASALAILAAMRLRTPRTWAALLTTLALAATGLTLLLRTDPDPVPDRTIVIPYEPVCVTKAIVVCVHPAYEPVLAKTADVVDRLLAPLVGIPGVPTRLEQFASAQGLPPDGTLDLHLFDEPINDEFVAEFIAYNLVYDSTVDRGPTFEEGGAAQRVVGCWLLRQGGWHGVAATECTILHLGSGMPDMTADVLAAVERFAALDPATRTAWLHAHWDELRAGRIGLEDLP